MPSDSGATVAFTDNCGGATSGAAVDLEGGGATFTWTAPAGTATCLLTATVSREGLSDAQSVAVAIL